MQSGALMMSACMRAGHPWIYEYEYSQYTLTDLRYNGTLVITDFLLRPDLLLMYTNGNVLIKISRYYGLLI